MAPGNGAGTSSPPGTPLVSVIIPAYNAAATLSEALDSVLGQTWPRVQILVVDDGSTDATRECAARYLPRGIQLISQANRGAAAARNAGLARATGDYIQYLDADDLLSPTKIAEQIALLQTAPANAVATCRWRRFSTTIDSAWDDGQPVYQDLQPLQFLMMMATAGAFVHPAAWLLPRAVATAAGPWNEALSLNDDGEYFARVARAAGSIVHCVRGFTYFRSYRQNSLSKRRDAEACRSQMLSVDLIAAVLLSLDDSAEARRACASLYLHSLVRIYPCPAPVSRHAEEKIRALGGGGLQPRIGGRAVTALARLFGWKAVTRVRRWLWSGALYPKLKRAWAGRARRPAGG